MLYGWLIKHDASPLEKSLIEKGRQSLQKLWATYETSKYFC